MSFVDWRKLSAAATVALLAHGHYAGADAALLTPTTAAATLAVLAFLPKGKAAALKPIPLEKVAAAADEGPLDAKYAATMEIVRRNIGKENAIESYDEVASTLSAACKEGMMDPPFLMRHNAEKLFWLHKKAPPLLSGGVAVRLTVQLNLFGGSVANLGSPAQVQQLNEIFAAGQLGCFALTEEGAGVLSGLIVETTATWGPEGYVLNTPTKAGRKFWISGGLKSQWAVVIARLILPSGKKDYGPHAFLVDIQSTQGVELADMEPKTAFNELDNAFMSFNKCAIAHGTLLSAISSVTAAGDYALADPKVPFRFEHVAQRLLSGRICIALAGLSMVRRTELEVRALARPLSAGKDRSMPLGELPALRSDLDLSYRVYKCLEAYSEDTQRRFISDKEIRAPLVERINAAKIVIMLFAIGMTMRLKSKVGACSLQKSGPFGSKNDLLYIFQFAEGDSGILKQKMARDALTATLASPAKVLAAAFYSVFGTGAQKTLGRAKLSLAWWMMGAKGQAKLDRWFAAHKLVEEVATAHCVLLVRATIARKMSAAELAAFDEYFAVHA
jgi:hypothetical protein